jgi:hypothetical protein
VTTRPRLRWDLTGDDVDRLVDWFVQSYDDGWRPMMQSHVRGRSAQFHAPWMRELRDRLSRDGEGGA